MFVVTGNSSVGLGHVYNALILANDLVGYEITFMFDSSSSLGCEKVLELNYPASTNTENLVDYPV